MKIAIGMRVRDSGFGGGNAFGKYLFWYLKEQGHEVFNNLAHPDLDIILMTEPRAWLPSCSFGLLEIIKYCHDVNKNVVVIHRVNECDERKGTRTVNKLLSLANSTADHTIYVGGWLVNLFAKYSFTPEYSVILNGADASVFTFSLKRPPIGNRRYRIITHHWSGHYRKGWDLYQELDERLTDDSSFEFHYVGNKPSGIKTKNIVYHDASAPDVLVEQLQQSHIYLTASLNEPGAMHPIEGASCGLPVLYRESGSLPEYCANYGIGFSNGEEMWRGLLDLKGSYTEFSRKMASYPHTAERMASQYLNVFIDTVKRRDELHAQRKTRRQRHYRKTIALKYFSIYAANRSHLS